MPLFNNDVNLDINSFIEKWNEKYPYDRWWRSKYGVPFGSKKHRETSFIDMVVEYCEDIFFKRLAEKKPDEFDELLDDQVEQKIGDKQIIKMNKRDVDQEFDDIDLSDFDDK